MTEHPGPQFPPAEQEEQQGHLPGISPACGGTAVRLAQGEDHEPRSGPGSGLQTADGIVFIAQRTACGLRAPESLDTNDVKAPVSIEPHLCPTGPGAGDPIQQPGPPPSGQQLPMGLRVQNALCCQGPQHELGWGSCQSWGYGAGAPSLGQEGATTRWGAGVPLLFSPPRSRSCTPPQCLPAT